MKSRQMALGGMLTAVAVVIMAMGSVIPLNTYLCPVLCILIHRVVLERCGKTLAWCYYIAVAILSLLLAPDREAAMVYVCLGYYPMIRRYFQCIRPHFLRTAAKLVFFTVAGAGAYGILLGVLGIGFGEESPWLMAVLIMMWDVLFWLVDRLLGMPIRRRKK